MSQKLEKPVDLLLPYQRRWVEDPSRFKIWLASRQIGKSFAIAAEVAIHCFLHPRQHWLLVSAGQRQSGELILKVKQWVTALQATIASENLAPLDTEAETKSEIVLANGSRITALPANPDTVRGYSAHVVLDEFAFHRDARAIWRAILPTITNPLRGALNIRVVSTPNGQGGQGAMFYQLWSLQDSCWSRHLTTIHQAREDGLPVDIASLRRAIADTDSWLQEYECQFIDTARVAFPYELLAQCESEHASMEWRPSFEKTLYYCGIDIGTLNDPTVAVTLSKIEGSRLRVTEVFILKNCRLSDQDVHLHPRIARAARTSIDASGLGLDLAQRMVRRYGAKVIAQPTTASWKRAAFQKLRSLLADGLLEIPADPTFRDDLHAYQTSGAGETETFWAPRSADGHSDIASALAHAVSAATTASAAWTPHALAGTLLIRRKLTP